jgi:hypothetical protein
VYSSYSAQQNFDFFLSIGRKGIKDVVLFLSPGFGLKSFEDLVRVFILLDPR